MRTQARRRDEIWQAPPNHPRSVRLWVVGWHPRSQTTLMRRQILSPASLSA